MGAAATRLQSFARHLSKAGHEVIIATGMPNYPSGVVFPAYQGRRTMKETIDGITLYRSAYYTAPRNLSNWQQLRSYLSFIPAGIRSGLKAGRIDLVIASSPPIFAIIPAIFLAKLRHAKFVFDVRDLWPDELIIYGAIREGSLPVRFIRSIERFGYKNSSLVVCACQGWADAISQRNVNREHILLAPNGADVDMFKPLPPVNTYTSQLKLDGKFVVLYSGLFGIKHGLEVILDTASLLKEQKDILFLLIGGGARLSALKDHANKLGLANVIFGGEHQVDEMPWYIACADVCVSSVVGGKLGVKAIPVKIYEYLACEKPVVQAMDGDGAKILADTGGGIVVPAGDAEGLAKGIMTLYCDPALREVMSKAGREYVIEHHSREKTAMELEKALRRIMGIDG
jgi:glycosyltransferase involved in cell wall biosynthesis